METVLKDSLPPAPYFEGDEQTFEQFLASYPDLAAIGQSLHRDGFAIVDLGFDAELIEAVKTFMHNRKENGRFQDGWLINEAIRELAVHEPVLSLLRTLYGREPIPFQTLNFKLGTQQKTHSDTFHFNSVPERFMCGVWIALEDIGETAGPLHYYPGSHKLPVFERTDLPGKQDYAAYESFIAEKMEAHGYERKIALLKAGQAFIWSANLFHGGSLRQDAQATRLSQVTHYFFEDCAYYTPAASAPSQQTYFIREPYNIARKTFIKSNSRHLKGRASLKYRAVKRLEVLLKRPP